jgi:hypothetical protein
MDVHHSPERTFKRKVFCILSARSLPYAEKCISSLFARSSEPLELTLITDDEADKLQIASAVAALRIPRELTWSIHSKRDADERAADILARYPNLQRFRDGHPCWRKLTDPLLFSRPGEEMIVLDPDLYFPNGFAFEPTPASGVLLMWQPPSCLLPDQTVMAAYRGNVKLAHHVDIGVAQLNNVVDLEWFERLVGTLGGKDIPRVMHVEAIAWAAIAMRIGGGYLDPTHWNCYQYRQWKRVALSLGISGVRLLKAENLQNAKCFHASGVAKWFVKDACERNLFPVPGQITTSVAPRPFEELTEREYAADQRFKKIVRRMGYYKLMRT